MSRFLEAVDRAQVLLRARGRITLAALRRELSLEDDALEDLVTELVDGQQVATRAGIALVWSGEASSPAPEQPEGRDPGERRQLTVMFCDVVDSTELAERVDPEELREILRCYRAICVEATKRFDGHVAQYLGDGVLVYFGTPRAHEDDAGRAIRTALEIGRLLRERPEASRIEARIGIHTGLVVVDPDGRGEGALALGSSTNIAARIQGLAKPGTVVVSEATLSLCRGLFVTRRIGETRIRGVETPVLLHEVRGTGVRRAIATKAATPMVGRELELGLLLDRWEEAQNGIGHVMLVSGEPGMGKSRLVQALRDQLRDSEHLWLDTQCSPYTSGSAFQPLVDLMNVGTTSGPAKTPEEASRFFLDGLEALPGLPGETVIPYLLALLSLPPSERYPLPQTSAEEQRERILAALLQLNLTLTEQQPVVMVVEDLHWSDPSTLEYLGRLVEQAATTRLMLVATYRPEFRAPWANSHISEVKLARLSRRMTRNMIANAVGGALPEPILAALEARSDGVPLFVEELASALLSSGLVAEQAGRLELRGRPEDLAIPTTLQDSLMARLDRLPTSKRVAQQAATVGREFSYELIEGVTELDAPVLRDALGQLVGAEILHTRGTPPDATYTFKHALLQDTAYESQLLSTRKQLHGRIAAVLEERFPGRVEAEPELMARHCEAAGAHGPAVEHYQRAAELALARLSNEEASEHFARALEALSSLPEDAERHQREIAIRVALGKALMTLRGYEAPEVVSTFGRVEDLCEAVGEGPQQLAALIGLLQFDVVRGQMSVWTERAERILRIAEPLGIREIAVLAHSLIGAALLTVSGFRAADRMAEALAIAEQIDFPAPPTPYDHDLISLTQTSRGIALVNSAMPEQAMESIQLGQERAAAIDHDFSRAFAAANAANAGFLMDDPEYTLSTAEQALAITQGRGFHSVELIGTIYRGWARARRGEIEKGVRDVENALQLARETGFRSLPLPYIAGANVYRMARQRERAEDLLAQATLLYERTGEMIFHHLVCATRARICVELGEGEELEAEKLYREAIDGTAKFEDLQRGLLVCTELARLALRTGHIREAHDLLAEHYARLTEGFDRGPAREARAALDELVRHLPAEGLP